MDNIEKGNLNIIVGKNGSGKTTYLNEVNSNFQSDLNKVYYYSIDVKSLEEENQFDGKVVSNTKEQSSKSIKIKYQNEENTYVELSKFNDNRISFTKEGLSSGTDKNIHFQYIFINIADFLKKHFIEEVSSNEFLDSLIDKLDKKFDFNLNGFIEFLSTLGESQKNASRVIWTETFKLWFDEIAEIEISNSIDYKNEVIDILLSILENEGSSEYDEEFINQIAEWIYNIELLKLKIENYYKDDNFSGRKDELTSILWVVKNLFDITNSKITSEIQKNIDKNSGFYFNDFISNVIRSSFSEEFEDISDVEFEDISDHLSKIKEMWLELSGINGRNISIAILVDELENSLDSANIKMILNQLLEINKINEKDRIEITTIITTHSKFIVSYLIHHEPNIIRIHKNEVDGKSINRINFKDWGNKEEIKTFKDNLLFSRNLTFLFNSKIIILEGASDYYFFEFLSNSKLIDVDDYSFINADGIYSLSSFSKFFKCHKDIFEEVIFLIDEDIKKVNEVPKLNLLLDIEGIKNTSGYSININTASGKDEKIYKDALRQLEKDKHTITTHLFPGIEGLADSLLTEEGNFFNKYKIFKPSKLRKILEENSTNKLKLSDLIYEKENNPEKIKRKMNEIIKENNNKIDNIYHEEKLFVKRDIFKKSKKEYEFYYLIINNSNSSKFKKVIGPFKKEQQLF